MDTSKALYRLGLFTSGRSDLERPGFVYGSVDNHLKAYHQPTEKKWAEQHKNMAGPFTTQLEDVLPHEGPALRPA
eukprot:scaffold15983_cov34-Prasinocladus_malaysianus.AAC.1